ncbi:hypothetical protein KLF26_09885 [Clostridium perfringens]|uniref:hypothetical protein n=1 Tax=Clostridium perfringens TaxID=1502 RepID=UPI001CCF78A4|nr:hypothetical protein [Clostridium perfringens]UBK99515.1 hypothetical protein KLF26_09885 [Clostridium perfringens]
MYKVDFIDIGGNNKSFSKEMKDMNWDSLYEAVSPCLVSSFSVGFTLNVEEGVGVVHAGFRTVGRFKFYKIEDSEYEL